jgi:hypothetical protein
VLIVAGYPVHLYVPSHHSSHYQPQANEPQDWVKDFSSSSEAGPSTQIQNNGDGKQPARLTAEKLAAYRLKWVRVPTDPTKAAQPCPICKEAFKGEWSEQEEEWVWKNAMEIGKKVGSSPSPSLFPFLPCKRVENANGVA